MAKKTTNYGANTALIQGAAAAYKNYDNVAGMYTGLQLATQTGANLATAVIDKQSEENKKYNESVKLYDDAADQVLLNSGTLSQKLYDSTYDELVKAKKIYLEGIDQKDDKKRIEGLKFIQNHSNWIQNHKAFNLQHAKDVKDGLMTSDYTAEENSIIAKIQTGDYTKTSRDEKTGDVVFHLDIDGEEKLVPSKEYEQLASIFKNDKVGVAHMQGKKYVLSQETFDADGYLVKVLGSLPSNESEWRGMVGNDLPGKRGGKQNLKSLLEQDMADGTLEAEIITALGIDVTKFDIDGDAVLSDTEKANFIDAVVNHKNDDFDLETSNQILKERLLKEAEGEHAEHWQKINAEKNRLENEQSRRFNLQNVEKTPSQYGYRTQVMMQNEYDAIKSGEIGDEITVKLDGVNYTFTRMNDGNFEHIGENNKSTIKTPNQIANLRDLIGFDRIPDPKGKNPFRNTNFPVIKKEK